MKTNNSAVLVKDSCQDLANDIKQIISFTKQKIEQKAKGELALGYWQIGKRINKENLTQNANYLDLLLKDLTKDVNLDYSILRRCVKINKTYPQGLPNNQNLNWSHYKSLISLKSDDLRLKLENKIKEENWSKNRLIEAIKVESQNYSQNLNSKIKRPNTPNYLYKAQVKDVVDGDTLILNIDLGFQITKEQRIRLAQIDAPEIKTKEGQEAFKFLRNKLAKIDEVIVRTNKIDIYGRFIGDIFYQLSEEYLPKTKPDGNSKTKKQSSQVEIFNNGVYLNEELVNRGFARVI